MRRRPGVLATALVMLAFVAGCGGDDGVAAPRDDSPTWVAVPDELEVHADRPATDPRQALALIPADATEVTMTDWREMRDRLGHPGLSGASAPSERSAFRERARAEGWVLVRGLLRTDASRLWDEHQLSQDDVQWEVRFRTPDGAGHVLMFRRDLPMARVRTAVADRGTGLRGDVLPGAHLLVAGGVAEDEQPLAAVSGVAELVAPGAESVSLRTSCIPIIEALGRSADDGGLETVLAETDVRRLRPLDAFSVSFSGPTATARLGISTGLHDRVDLVEIWPSTGHVDWDDAFRGMPVGDSSSGRVGLQVRDVNAAIRLVRSGRLPFAICNDA